MAFLAIPAVAASIGAAGAGISALGAISGGIASSNLANYQAAIARNNATIAQQNATYVSEAGRVATEAQGRKGAAKEASLKVAQAANGVDVNTGSAVDVQASQREADQLDTETVQHAATLKAYGYRNTADNFNSEAVLDQAKGENAKTGSYLSAAGSLLSNASSIGGKWGSGTSWTGGASTPAEDLEAGIRPV